MKYTSEPDSTERTIKRLILEPDERRHNYLQLLLASLGTAILLVACLVNSKLFPYVAFHAAICVLVGLYGFVVTTRRHAKELMALPDFLAIVRPLTNSNEQLPWNDVRQISVWQISNYLCLSIRSDYGIRIDLCSLHPPHDGILAFFGDLCARSGIPNDSLNLQDIGKKVCILTRQDRK